MGYRYYLEGGSDDSMHRQDEDYWYKRRLHMVCEQVEKNLLHSPISPQLSVFG